MRGNWAVIENDRVVNVIALNRVDTYFDGTYFFLGENGVQIGSKLVKIPTEYSQNGFRWGFLDENNEELETSWMLEDLERQRKTSTEQIIVEQDQFILNLCYNNIIQEVAET